MLILALADDLTGALEVGVKLPGSVVTVDLATTRETRSLVIDTESRHLNPAEAAARVTAAVSNRKPAIVYKKTDSTLRGNIGAELGALSAAFPDRAIVFVPAYPVLGRTVRDGQLYVHGELLHTTAFARDPLNPMTSSLVSDAVRGCGVPVQVFDAESEEDVARVVRMALAMSPIPVIAGPGNVAAYLDLWRPISRCLVVNGSLHPMSIAQWETGRARQWKDWTFSNRWIPGDFDTLIVFGGDTAFGILETLGVTEIYPMAEVLPGVPISRIGELRFISKAGGFGEVDVLTRIRDAFSQAR